MSMSQRKLRASPADHEHARQKAARQRLKVGAFVIATLAILGIAAFLVVSPLRAVRGPASNAAAPAGEIRQVMVNMAGFDPRTLRVRAGQPFTVRLVNPDSQFHTDGGGWHQFRIEKLDVDVRIPPKSERSQTFARLAPGTYEFYCDICCGGKENPEMRGVIEVTG
jgi:heme/copper-type cytochrome/quinol oxidase subunit 2